MSGSFIANALVQAGLKCVMLEAGRDFSRDTYPRTEVDANSLLYWGGGIELTKDASIGLLRPKVVGGGSIVNQALLDRFDDDAFDSWRAASGVPFLTRADLDPWYDARRGADRDQHRAGGVRQRQRRGLPRRLRAQRLSLRAAGARAARLPLRGRQLLHRVPDGLPHRQQAEHAGHAAEARPRRRAGGRVRSSRRAASSTRAGEVTVSGVAADGGGRDLPRQDPRPRRRRHRQLAPAARLRVRQAPAGARPQLLHPPAVHEPRRLRRAGQRAPRAAAVVQVGRPELPPQRLQARERLRPAGGRRHADPRLRRRAHAAHEADHPLRLHRGGGARHQPRPHPRQLARRARWSRSGSTTRTRAGATAAWRRSATSSSPPARRRSSPATSPSACT